MKTAESTAQEDDVKTMPVASVAFLKPDPPKPKKLSEKAKEERAMAMLSPKERETVERINAFAAMTPEQKIAELQSQLKAERCRVATAETEISPIVGTEKQSEELMAYLTEKMSLEPAKVWELNMFGKSMSDLVKEGIQSKLYRMPEDAQMKLQEALQKIINEGSGGLICIIL